MPVLTKDTRLTVINDPDIIWIKTEYQVIKSLTLLDKDHAYDPTDAVAEIGVMSGGRKIYNRIACFSYGYVGSFSPLFWTGSYPTENDCYVYALVSGPDNHVYRLAVTLWKIITIEGGRFVVDP